MAEKLNTAKANHSADSFYDDFNGGTADVYTGSQPATGDTAPSGSLLGTINLPNPAFAAASGGAKAKSGTWQYVASAAGNMGWFRMKNAAGTRSMDGAITATGGGGEMEFDNVNVAIGQTVTINTGTGTQPLS